MNDSTRGVRRAVLLAGGLSPPPLSAAAGCSVLDLWLTPSSTVLDLWLETIRSLGAPATHILWNRQVPRPTVCECPDVSMVRDPTDYRGPAGSLRDTCADLDRDDTILVGEATRYVDADVHAMLEIHRQSAADVTVGSNADRTPAGIYLVQRGALDLVPGIGFMDLKEQWLPRAVEMGRRVIVHAFAKGGAHMLRTREQFLAAARLANADERAQTLDATNARVVSVRASVHESARLWGSVIMERAVIEPGAIVVRSLVGPGGYVPRAAVVVDRVVPAVMPS